MRQHTAHWISAHAPPNHADSVDDALPAQRCHLLANTGNLRSYNISPETNRHCEEHSGVTTDGVRDDAADDDADLHECMSAGSSSSEGEECIKLPPPVADSRARAHPAHWYETPCSGD